MEIRLGGVRGMGGSGKDLGFLIILAGLAIGAALGTVFFGVLGFFVGAVVGLAVGLVLS
jgi:hypothetical protein